MAARDSTRINTVLGGFFLTFWRSRQIVAYYYNQAAARGQKVVVNDRFGQKKEGVSDTRGVYGEVDVSAQRSNLQRIFPDGVCDYSKPDSGLPVAGWFGPKGDGVVDVKGQVVDELVSIDKVELTGSELAKPELTQPEELVTLSLLEKVEP